MTDTVIIAKNSFMEQPIFTEKLPFPGKYVKPLVLWLIQNTNEFVVLLQIIQWINWSFTIQQLEIYIWSFY